MNSSRFHTLEYDHDEHHDDVFFPANVPLLMESVNAAQWGTWMSFGATIRPFSKWKSPLDPEVKSMLVLRPGGFGDLLFMTPAIHQLKLQRPELRIVFACRRDCIDALQGNPDIDGFMVYPPRLDQMQQFDSIQGFSDVIEYSEKAHTTHAVDLYAEVLEVELPADARRMRMFLSEDERMAIRQSHPRGWRRRIAVQLSASSPVRTYPGFQTLMYHLADEKTEVWCIGKRGQDMRMASDDPRRRIFNTHDVPTLSFRQCCALLETCDCLIAPDSAMTHVAEALDVPCVALYASFPAALRVANAPKTLVVGPDEQLLANPGHGLEPITCAPCFHHSRRSLLPPQCPGLKIPKQLKKPKKGEPPPQPPNCCMALASISAKMILDAVNVQVNRYRKKFQSVA